MRIAADEAAEMFAHARVARLATVGTELAPHLVPVTFAVIEVPAPDLPAPDLPAPDLPAPDLPAPDLPAPDLSSPDLSAADLPASAWSQVIVFAVDHKPKSTTALRRLDNIAANPQVCFLVDRY